MNNYSWKSTTQTANIKRVLDDSQVVFSAKAIDMDFDIETLIKDPQSFANMEIILKELNGDIEKHYDGYFHYIEKGYIMPIWILYNCYKHTMVEYKFVEDITMGSDGFVKITTLPEKEDTKYRDWAKKLERKIEHLIDEDEIKDLRGLCNTYAEMEHNVTKYAITYSGPTVKLDLSSETTIREFKEIFARKCHMIPILTNDKTNSELNDNRTLGEILDINGDFEYAVPCGGTIGDIQSDFYKKYKRGIGLMFKHVERTWALLDPDTPYFDADKKPPFFKSLGFALALKFIQKHNIQ